MLKTVFNKLGLTSKCSEGMGRREPSPEDDGWDNEFTVSFEGGSEQPFEESSGADTGADGAGSESNSEEAVSVEAPAARKPAVAPAGRAPKQPAKRGRDSGAADSGKAAVPPADKKPRGRPAKLQQQQAAAEAAAAVPKKRGRPPKQQQQKEEEDDDDEEEEEQQQQPAKRGGSRLARERELEQQLTKGVPLAPRRSVAKAKQALQQQQPAAGRPSRKGSKTVGATAAAAAAARAAPESEEEQEVVEEQKQQQQGRGSKQAGRGGRSSSAKAPAAAGKPAGKRKQPASAAAGLQEPAAAAEAEAEAVERPSKRGRRSGAAAHAPHPASMPAEQPAGASQQRQQQRGRQQQAAASPPTNSPKYPQQQQQRQQKGLRSPTPVAAAAQRLEVSVPPGGEAEAEADWRRGTTAAAAAAAGGRQIQQQQQQRGAWGAADGDDEEMEEEEEEEEGGQGAVVVVRHTDPGVAATDWMLRRLGNSRCREAASMQLRPRLQEVHDSLLSSLSNTVELGHNNSVLLIGPRGSGKTLVLERALAAGLAVWNADCDPRDVTVGVVRLFGLAHSEERVAFREVARQLCEQWRYPFSQSASVAENIAFLKKMLHALAGCDKVVLFVLDDFDLFASRQRSKQTLLYNLLDALQISGIKAAVVGMSCRHDVMELLEKRVKSRFSHRKIELSLPTSVLALPEVKPTLDHAGREAQDGAMDVLQAMLTLPLEFPFQQYAAHWNRSVVEAGSSREVQQLLQRCIDIYPSLRYLAHIADYAIANAAREAGGAGGQAGSSGWRQRQLTKQHLMAAIERQIAHSKTMVYVISDLPILDLILLVAVHRLTARGQEDFNFEMAFHEFQRYTTRGDHVDLYGKSAASKAYDHLLQQRVVACVDQRNQDRVGSRQFAAAYMLVTREEVEEGMEEHWNCPDQLKQWFKKEAGPGTTAQQFL